MKLPSLILLIRVATLTKIGRKFWRPYVSAEVDGRSRWWPITCLSGMLKLPDLAIQERIVVLQEWLVGNFGESSTSISWAARHSLNQSAPSPEDILLVDHLPVGSQNAGRRNSWSSGHPWASIIRSQSAAHDLDWKTCPKHTSGSRVVFLSAVVAVLCCLVPLCNT